MNRQEELEYNKFVEILDVTNECKAAISMICKYRGGFSKSVMKNKYEAVYAERDSMIAKINAR